MAYPSSGFIGCVRLCLDPVSKISAYSRTLETVCVLALIRVPVTIGRLTNAIRDNLREARQSGRGRRSLPVAWHGPIGKSSGPVTK
jgi:hypothetical protein